MPGDILVLQNINKHFGGIRALIDVSLAVRKGEIHALVGENGAGKSTLIKILTGAIHRDSGEIWFNGQKQTIENPVQSREIGIAAIYQEVNLFPQLPVMYNLFFGNEPTRGRLGWLRSRSIRTKAGELLKKFGVEIDPSTPIGELGLGQKRIVEILKAISLNAQFLIMDEATTGMSRAEITTLFDIVRDLKKRHVTVLYISHHLEEVFELADRVSVLRDGTLIDTFATEKTSVEALSRAIVGREIRDAGVLEHIVSDAVALEVTELLIPRLQKPISFTLKQGEILGITGVVGAGKTEIGRALFGVDPILSGSVKICGREYTSLTPQKAKEIG
ncbi:sugar ABC transporter ATP-binding protein, partial [Candidatus Acetothermia bacterium]